MAKHESLPYKPEWARIEAEAREQNRSDLARLRETPLELGQPIAWAVTTKVGRATEKLSSVHRVGVPKGNVAYTTCDIPIPDPLLWFPLSPALIRTMARCGFCETAHVHGMLGSAA